MYEMVWCLKGYDYLKIQERAMKPGAKVLYKFIINLY